MGKKRRLREAKEAAEVRCLFATDEKRLVDLIVGLVTEQVGKALEERERGRERAADEKRIVDLIVRLVGERVDEIVRREVGRALGEGKRDKKRRKEQRKRGREQERDRERNPERESKRGRGADEDAPPR